MDFRFKTKSLFCLGVFLLGFNVSTWAQKVSLNYRNVKVEKVLSSIKSQTRMGVVYSDEIMDVNRKVSIQVQEVELPEALNKILAGTNVTYEIRDNKIYFIEKQSASNNKTKKIKGIVKTENGDPIIGANIVVVGDRGHGVITDIDGNFTLDVPQKGAVEVTYLGYTTQTVYVKGKSFLDITLREDLQSLEEVVVVGYGTQRKGNLTGSVANVKSEKLTVAPVGNVTNTLAGQLPGLTAKQTSGIPGSDGAMLRIRGFDAPLTIIDGIEGDFSNIDASQIESISILKDGAAAIYGARAGNGVILVTTKRGIDSKAVVSLNSSFTFQGATNVIKPGTSAQRAAWVREEHINKGNPESSAPFTLEQIKKFEQGTDPNYLNTDWYDAVMRKWAPQQNHNLSVRGGNDKVKYYGYAGYNKQETMVKKNGGDYERFNIQSNIDAKINDRISVTFDMLLIKENQYFPSTGSGFGHSNFWATLYDTNPRYPLYLPDPSKNSYGGTSTGNVLFASDTEAGGYNDNDKTRVRANGAVIYSFKYVDGLKFKASINYDTYNTNMKIFNKQAQFYSYNPDNGAYTYERASETPTGVTEVFTRGHSLTQQYSFTYDRLFNEKHRLHVLGLFESIDYKDKRVETGRSGYMSDVLDQLFAGNGGTASNGGWEGEMGRVSWVGRINYSYKDRYLVETILRADASAKFPKGSRWGYFPGVSLGWVMSEENFMDKFNAVDNIKWRASYGESGNDNVGNFQYLAGYSFDGSYKIGDNIKQGLYPVGLANPTLTWEKMKIVNGGVDFSFFKRKLYGTFEAFYRVRDGIPGNRAVSLPSSFGAELPLENLNSIDTRGWELSLGTSGNINKLYYDITGNISWVRSKWKDYDEPNFEDPDQARLYTKDGRWTDVRYGYVSDGLFTSMDEIKNLPYTYKELGGNSSLRPGDIKYKDLNGDNVLDWKDQRVIGKGALPLWSYGFNVNLKYANFDLSALFQGAFGYTAFIDMTRAASELKYKHRWTEIENNPNSLVARPGGASSNNYYSDFNNHNVSYLRLKNLAIGYELPKVWLSKVGIQKLRIYFAGTNLFTLSSIHKYGVDPEVPEGSPAYYYPQQRTISAGLNLTF